MNNTIFFFFYNLAHQSQILDKIVVFFAVYFPYAVVFLAGVFLLMHHEVFKAENTWEVLMQKKKEILLGFFSGGLAWIIAKLLKVFIHTPRPFDVFPSFPPGMPQPQDLHHVVSLFPETGFSFPSGHATFFMALAISIFLTHKKAGCIFILFAVLIGIARIIGGVHFPADILGGFILGAAVACLVAYFAKNV